MAFYLLHNYMDFIFRFQYSCRISIIKEVVQKEFLTLQFIHQLKTIYLVKSIILCKILYNVLTVSYLPNLIYFLVELSHSSCKSIRTAPINRLAEAWLGKIRMIFLFCVLLSSDAQEGWCFSVGCESYPKPCIERHLRSHYLRSRKLLYILFDRCIHLRGDFWPLVLIGENSPSRVLGTLNSSVPTRVVKSRSQ